MRLQQHSCEAYTRLATKNLYVAMHRLKAGTADTTNSVLHGSLPVSGAPGRILRNCTGFGAFWAVFEHFCTGFSKTSRANHTGNPCTLSQIARVFGPFASNHTEPVRAVER
jgi:hypothetical protein